MVFYLMNESSAALLAQCARISWFGRGGSHAPSLTVAACAIHVNDRIEIPRMAVAFPAVAVINAQSRADRCPQLEQLNFSANIKPTGSKGSAMKGNFYVYVQMPWCRRWVACCGAAKLR
jgi:hypothetical protein